MPDRLEERAEIRRLLDLGHSLQMLAPRRVGKTWLMHRVAEDLRAEGWLTVFTDVEGVRTEDEFLRDLCRRIEEVVSIKDTVFTHLTHRLKHLGSTGWEGNPVNAIGRVDPKSFSEALVASLGARGGKTLVLVDEIALFVSGLLDQNEAATREFMYHLRKLRQAHPNVRWLLTGSIGLDVVARRARLQGALVDMDIFPLEPFGERAARTYLERQCADGAVRWPFELDDATFAQLARDLGWLAPFYLDLIANRIRPTGTPGPNGRPQAVAADVDAAFDELLKPAYRGHFSTWEEHIDKNFPPDQSKALHAILAICCEAFDGETTATLQTRLATDFPTLRPRDLKDHLTALANDGFVHEADGRWRFRSGLLRRYWLKYMHD
jgi:hypothetical protein